MALQHLTITCSQPTCLLHDHGNHNNSNNNALTTSQLTKCVHRVLANDGDGLRPSSVRAIDDMGGRGCIVGTF